MMATRPREEGAAAAAASSSQEEKSIPGVSSPARHWRRAKHRAFFRFSSSTAFVFTHRSRGTAVCFSSFFGRKAGALSVDSRKKRKEGEPRAQRERAGEERNEPSTRSKWRGMVTPAGSVAAGQTHARVVPKKLIRCTARFLSLPTQSHRQFAFVSFGDQVSRDALKEERTPLLDLDDVEQLESELAAFDAPPPPPLNIRVSGWAGRGRKPLNHRE